MINEGFLLKSIFPLQDIMNREKESQLPMMQVNFIDTICLPIYEVGNNESLIIVNESIHSFTNHSSKTPTI